MTKQPAHTVCPACSFNASTSPNPDGTLPLNTHLHDDFMIGKLLGTGGFGVTYLGYDENLNRSVAIKEYFPRDQCSREHNRISIAPLAKNSEDIYHYGLEKFLEEAKILAQFEEVPGIVNTRRFFKANNTGYIVMDYLHGMNLQDYLKQRGDKVPFDEAFNILVPIFDALKEVHKAGLLHRDISPDNIFITQKKQIKLIDFGAARIATRDRSQNFSVILKEGYAPEEQYRRSGVQGPWSDIYALAATLYRSITGTLPPQALDRLADGKELPKPSDLNIDISPQQESALLMGLALRANDRFQDIDSFHLAFTDTNRPTIKLKKLVQKETPKPPTHNPQAAYQTAYKLHYSFIQTNIQKAKQIYLEIIKNYPNSKEAGDASSQLNNLEKDLGKTKAPRPFKSLYLSAREAYHAAHQLHYIEEPRNVMAAEKIYRNVIKHYPEAQEALWADSQLKNIAKHHSPSETQPKETSGKDAVSLLCQALPNYFSIHEIRLSGGLIKLDDGTTWEVMDNCLNLSSGWNVGDTVQIAKGQLARIHLGGSAKTIPIHVHSQAGVGVLTDIRKKGGIVEVDNKLLWEVEEFSQPEVRNWSAQSTVAYSNNFMVYIQSREVVAVKKLH